MRQVPISKIFDYFSDFEAYKERYPTYCADIQIIEKSDSQIRTKELWNLSIGEMEHTRIEVLYTLKPPTEIEYEIVEGYGKGTLKRMQFESRSDAQTHVNMNLPAFDIVKILLPKDLDYSNYASQIAQYLIKQDSRILEGKYQGEFAEGQLCPKCQKGKLIFWGKGSQESADRRESKEEEAFRCQFCGHEFGNAKLSVNERIDVG